MQKKRAKFKEKKRAEAEIAKEKKRVEIEATKKKEKIKVKDIIWKSIENKAAKNVKISL